ncbi:MAG: hypothetical protein ABIP95_12070 [Pelobium sp.]
MQRLLFTCLICLFAKFTFAQEPKVTSIINFTGTIGTYPVEMQFRLVQKKDAIDGEYYYVKSGRDSKIFLSGTFKNGNLLLEESAYDSKKKEYVASGFFMITTTKKMELSGTWGKNRSEAMKANALKVNLVGKENLTIFDPLKFKYSITKQKANYENMSEVASSYYSITSLTIDNNLNNPQKIIGFNELDLVDEKVEIELEDMNFDGYLDVKLMINYPDRSKGDYSYLYYIYDLKQAKFIRNKVLDNIGVAFFDAPAQTVFKYDADGSGNEGTSTYKWQNGNLYLIKEERVYEDDIYVHYKEYKVMNGKSVQVKSYKKKE